MPVGSVQNVSVNGRNFPVAADADGARNLGGRTNEVQSNGNGTVRVVQTRVPWSVGGLTLGINDDANDQKFLQDLADSGSLVPFTFELAGGQIYRGNGTISDNIEFSTQNGTASVTFMGEQKLEQQ
jgi:methyl coenzyme M reductase subunit D